MKVDSTRGSSNWNRIHRYAIGHFAGIKRIPTLVGWDSGRLHEVAEISDQRVQPDHLMTRWQASRNWHRFRRAVRQTLAPVEDFLPSLCGAYRSRNARDMLSSIGFMMY
jgi:hypothetical protein